MDKTSKNNKYNFKQNLIALSRSDVLEEALNEWEMINKQPETTKRSVCICQKVIKHIHYLYNPKTHKFAFVGTACVSKFQHTFKTMKSKTFRRVILYLFSDGIYEHIDNLDLYSEEVKLRVITYFEMGLNHKTNEEKIAEIECLINDFGCDYLKGLLEKYKGSNVNNQVTHNLTETRFLCQWCGLSKEWAVMDGFISTGNGEYDICQDCCNKKT